MKFPPDFSLSGRWIVLIIGTEVLKILMSPCIHFVARARFPRAKALFTLSLNRSFSINPAAHCNWLPHPDFKSKKIHYLFAFIPPFPLAVACLLPIKSLPWLNLLQVRWKSISNHESCPHLFTPPALPSLWGHQPLDFFYFGLTSRASSRAWLEWSSKKNWSFLLKNRLNVNFCKNQLSSLKHIHIYLGKPYVHRQAKH